MYNTNLKNQYISTLGKSEQLYALGSFNTSEVLEVAFEKKQVCNPLPLRSREGLAPSYWSM